MPVKSRAPRPVWLLALFALNGCGNSQVVVDAPPAPTDAASSQSDAAIPAVSFDDLVNAYGNLSTIGGTALIGDKDVNGWQPSFEGGPATSAELSRPHIAVADANGTIFIADKDAHAVRAISPNGVITTVAGTGVAGDDGDTPSPATERRLNAPNGLWVTADGSLYILDLGNDKIRKRSPAGELTTLFSIGGAGTGRGLWVADDESLAYVAAGNLIRKWTPSGATVLASGFLSLGNLVVDGEGNVIATDRAGHRVYRVSPDGTKTPIAGNGTPSGGGHGQPALATGLDEVRGVWIYPGGGLLLATHHGSQVWFIDTVGTAHLFIDGGRGDVHAGDGEPISSPGKKVSEVRAITMDGAGNILITEHDGGYIRRVAKR